MTSSGGAGISLPPNSYNDDEADLCSTTSFLRIQEHTGRTLLVVHPQTGRRHQIRVHLAWIGHPILGDPLFDDPDQNRVSRTFLHSWRLSFTSPATVGDVAVTAPPGDDFWAVLPGTHAAGRDVLLLAAAADAVT